MELSFFFFTVKHHKWFSSKFTTERSGVLKYCFQKKTRKEKLFTAAFSLCSLDTSLDVLLKCADIFYLEMDIFLDEKKVFHSLCQNRVTIKVNNSCNV